MLKVEVIPPVSGGDDLIELLVDLPQSVNILIMSGFDGRVIDKVVEIGKSKLPPEHDLPAFLI
ncbi:hypothetical protein [Schaalia hyovaginalis]|uniref:hypothetical protein n=1 Tax=Schaalia hyovaginalis TaxID=29316 RepID=UPI0026EB41BD|nr:hypothetical protein [Schaalia hyovaginalis]MCI6410399.1 hypothetical protein [Schaalia hyovaginalis]